MTQNRELTPEQEAAVEENLGEMLHSEKDAIAASLGIHPQWEGDGPTKRPPASSPSATGYIGP
ncbi:hypothetical protein [Mesorhizobium sp.]|uniref:hypothetical protein n=1 Tax=Mesorhizobium sp. TaxID=1871066 RepID=UPI000FE591EE|nr:hypothetical protein [Mesorhizobium sp.]RWO55386.1 MAG: hypothetical protein EOS14_30075 [Mesorhizobium sp.]